MKVQYSWSTGGYIVDMDPNYQIAPHFKLKELANNKGNPAQPQFIITERSSTFLRMLEEFRVWYAKSMTVNSCYRQPTYNKSVGGDPNSGHIYALALDWGIRNQTDAQRKNVATKWESICKKYNIVGSINYYTNGYYLEAFSDYLYGQKKFTIRDYRNKKGDWKESVQRYEINELKNIAECQRLLLEDEYAPTETRSFTLNERGRTRLIKPNTVRDRVVYKSFNKNVLLPNVTPKLIYDNGASLKGKGLSFARKRFEVHLRSAYKEYGGNAYILFMDFSKYFDNIDYEIAERQYSKFLDVEGMHLLNRFLESNAIDVSYMTDEQYEEEYNKPFNALAYESANHEKRNEKYYHRSVGIGSENSQTTLS